MKKIVIFQICAILVISGGFTALMLDTDIYEEVESGIVKVLCLSCIKLNPKTSIDFTFETANKQPHPDFVVDELKTKGPVFLQYGQKACPACDDMINFVIRPMFDIDFDKNFSYQTDIQIYNSTLTYIYIFRDDDSETQERKDSLYIYDKDNIEGLPMFTLVTIEYEHGGDILPYYVTLYSKFVENENYDEMQRIFLELIKESIEMYNRNIEGFS